ncbi:hypothetical protein DEO72_LG11g2047 [Vigna unguiculata]|uniref:Uncharacterized protein n=1 Tax=Vigna unguiculata TaxID=3917 RepID=A0A4D6NRB5_VIGUN|nr:hypothetical protein DEO72_LG11g2047 [Vigna unguiculata]
MRTNNTRKSIPVAISPGDDNLSVARRKYYPDRLGGHPCRQAPSLFQPHCFRVYHLAEHTLPPDATRYKDTIGGPIAWQTLVALTTILHTCLATPNSNYPSTST